MSDSFVVKIEGLDILAERLKGLGPDISKKTLASAVAAGAGVVKRSVIAKAEAQELKDTGRLLRSIYIKRIRKTSNAQQAEYIVGVRSGKKFQKSNRDAYYWFWHEFGTEKMPARPFVRPGFESSKFDADGKIKNVLVKKVDSYNNYVIG